MRLLFSVKAFKFQCVTHFSIEFFDEGEHVFIKSDISAPAGNSFANDEQRGHRKQKELNRTQGFAEKIATVRYANRNDYLLEASVHSRTTVPVDSEEERSYCRSISTTKRFQSVVRLAVPSSCEERLSNDPADALLFLD